MSNNNYILFVLHREIYLINFIRLHDEYAQEDVVIMLIDNKEDRTSERQVRMEDGESIPNVGL